MNNKFTDRVTLLFAIGGLAIAWYFFAIVYLARHPRPEQKFQSPPTPTQSASIQARAKDAAPDETTAPRAHGAGTAAMTPSPTTTLAAPIAPAGTTTPTVPVAVAPAPAATRSITEGVPEADVGQQARIRRTKAADMGQSTDVKSNELPDDFAQFMALSVTALGGTLATFVGMVMGRSQAAKAEETSLTMPQMTAAWAYVVSLALALFIWYSSPSNCDDAIRHLGQSFLGLVGGALTVMLNSTPRTGTTESGS